MKMELNRCNNCIADCPFKMRMDGSDFIGCVHPLQARFATANADLQQKYDTACALQQQGREEIADLQRRLEGAEREYQTKVRQHDAEHKRVYALAQEKHQIEAQLAAAEETHRLCEQLSRERLAQIDELRERAQKAEERGRVLEGLIGVAKCPDCDGGGVYPVDDGYGGCEPVQCEWCARRVAALSQKDIPVKTDGGKRA